MARRQEGQVLVLAAAMSLILVAFVGLVVDGGEIAAQARASQNAADGAALAAAYDVLKNTEDETHASTLANLVAGQTGIPIGTGAPTYDGSKYWQVAGSDLKMSYYDSLGNQTSVLANVAAVQADVTHTFGTLFLPIINIDTATVSSTAKVNVTRPGGDCAVCVMDATAANALNVTTGTTTVSGGSVRVNSSSLTALNVAGALTDSGSPAGIYVTGNKTGTGSFSPTPTVQSPPVVDPFANVATPPDISAAPYNCPNNGDVSAGGGPGPGGAFYPGLYHSMSGSGSGTFTLLPGNPGSGQGCGVKALFVITGGIDLGGGKGFDSTSGVTVYMTCAIGSGATPNNPTPCAAGGQSGAYINSHGNLGFQFGGPAFGPWTRMALFFDRNNTGQLTINSNGGLSMSITNGGSVYARSSPVWFEKGPVSVTARIVARTLQSDVATTINYNAAQNYSEPDKLTLAV